MQRIKITQNSFDELIVCIMLYYVLIGIWLGVGVGIIQKVIVVLCLARILYYLLKNRRSYNQTILCIVVVLFFLVLNYAMFGGGDFFRDNAEYILNCWSVVTYFSFLLQTERRWLKNFLVRITRVLNVYMCINIVIMFLQLNESYFLIDRSRIPTVVYYPDYIAGLLGINGTHRLTLLCILFLYLNMFVFRFRHSKNPEKIPRFIWMVSACLFCLSTQNDNVTFFVLYPLFFCFMYALMYSINYKRIGKMLLVAVGAVFLISIIISANSAMVREIGARIENVLQVYILGNNKIWDERTEFLRYALVHGKGNLLGSGFGSVKMYSDARIGLHWGMNSLMTFTYFMGIVPLLSYLGLHVLMYTNSMERHLTKKKLVIRGGIFVFFLLLVQYCQILSELNLIILFSLIVSVIVLTVDQKEESDIL